MKSMQTNYSKSFFPLCCNSKRVFLLILMAVSLQMVKAQVKSIIYVNENVTTHIVMPEPIKMMDISTQKIVGNQCADNIVRLKPASPLSPFELAGTITLIGERHMVQYDIVYTASVGKASSLYYVSSRELQGYNNPNVSMTMKDMSRLAWSIYTSKKKFYNITAKKYGMQ